MNYKSYVGAFLLMVGVGFAVYLFVVEGNPLDVAQDGQTEPTAKKIAALADNVSPPTSPIGVEKNCITAKNDTKLYPSVELRSMAANQGRIDELIANGYSNLSPLLSKARSGDPAAAIAAFNMLTQCYSLKISDPKTFSNIQNPLPSTNPSCPAFPQQFAENPLSILLVAAGKGSAEAATVFATNSLSIAAYYRRLKTKESIAYADKLIADALRYGDSAARSGLIESIIFMANGQRSGAFGRKDNVQAFAYALPLTETRDSEVRIFAHGLARNLSKAEIYQANLIAYGCKISKSSEVQNPFTQP